MVDNGRAAIRAHDQQTTLRRKGFQFPFLVHGHVVAKEHHVDVLIQALLGDPCRELARHGDDRHVQVGVHLQRTLQGGGGIGRGFAVRLFIDEGIHGLYGVGEGRLVRAADGHKKVIGPHRLESRGVQAQIGRDFPIQFRSHAHQGFFDAFQLLNVLGDEHQGHGIVIRIFPNFKFYQTNPSSMVGRPDRAARFGLRGRFSAPPLQNPRPASARRVSLPRLMV